MAFYVICDDDSRHESMTKEQILAAITQAINTGSIGNCDTGFVTKLREQNSGNCVTVWVGTQAQYNAIEEKEKNCLYIITDDTKFEDMEKAIARTRFFVGYKAFVPTILANSYQTSKFNLGKYNGKPLVSLYFSENCGCTFDASEPYEENGEWYIDLKVYNHSDGIVTPKLKIAIMGAPME